jgi:hypothetical protein
MRESISSALDGHSTRKLTNAEIDDISTTDDYKEQLGKIKQLIGERGNTVVDELIERPSWSSSYGSWIYNYLCNQ